MTQTDTQARIGTITGPTPLTKGQRLKPVYVPLALRATRLPTRPKSLEACV